MINCTVLFVPLRRTVFVETVGCLLSKKDGKEFAMKELMSTSRQASKAAEKEANMLLFLGIYQNGSLEY